jgi:hypothetical protein
MSVMVTGGSRTRDVEVTEKGILLIPAPFIIDSHGRFENVTKRRMRRIHCALQATLDARTGLANYRERVGSAPKSSVEAPQREFARLLFDLDGLKQSSRAAERRAEQ